jgi:hypothetical protein
MFDEAVSPDVRHYFEDVVSKLSVFMAQQGTPTVSVSISFCFFFIQYFSSKFSMVIH